jgi:hypothetical protein
VRLLIKPSEDVVRAIVNLNSSPSFDTFLGWIHDSLVTQSIQNNRNTGEMAVKKAGGCVELEEILNHIKKAPDYVANLRESKLLKEALS